MKTVVSTFLALFIGLGLFAQNYVSDEFIVEYVEGTTPAEQQVIRDLFSITTTTVIGENIELWSGIPFPLTVVEDNETIIINDVSELIHYINIQEGEDPDSIVSNINNGNLNYIIDIFGDGVIHDGGTFDPLPYCDDVHNDRLIRNYQSGNPNQSNLKIIIVDQLVDNIPSVNLMPESDTPGGNHGNKVYSVINNILTQAGITEVEYLNLNVFNEDGQSTVATLIRVVTYIAERFYADEWSNDDPILVNFSANIIFPDQVYQYNELTILRYRWEYIFGTHGLSLDLPLANNTMLISSAGNQASGTNNVFPGAGDLISEVTVAGTQNCFSTPWTGTNYNPTHYEIAAEAVGILTEDNGDYYISSGTSFSSALVTAVVAQLALDNPHLDMREVRDLLLNTADQVPALAGTVQNGRVLNIENYISGTHGGGSTGGGPGGPGGGFGGRKLTELNSPTKSLSLTTTPNPFTTSTFLTIELPNSDDVSISMYNLMGQIVHEEFIPNQQELQEMEWPTPTHLSAGTYLIRVQVGNEVVQRKVVKQ